MRFTNDPKQQPKTKRSKVITKLIGFLVIILGIIQVVVANQTAASGQKAQNLDEITNKLQEENRQLEIEVAKYSSLSYIEEQAAKQGFVKASSLIFLNNPLPVALKRE